MRKIERGILWALALLLPTPAVAQIRSAEQLGASLKVPARNVGKARPVKPGNPPASASGKPAPPASDRAARKPRDKRSKSPPEVVFVPVYTESLRLREEQQLRELQEAHRQATATECSPFESPLIPVQSREGWYRVQYSSGQDEISTALKNGAPDGTFRKFHPNGKKAEEGQFDQGVREGTWTAWYPNGKKRIEAEYRKGARHGRWRCWHFSGKLAEEGDYRDEVAVGEWTLRDERGNILFRETLKAPAALPPSDEARGQPQVLEDPLP